MCFRLQAPYQVLQARADDKAKDMRPGKGSFARKVDRISHLGVTHAHSSRAADLDTEVNSARIGDVHDRTKFRQLAREIPILAPPIQRKRLIEAKRMLPNGSHAETHIAAVNTVPRANLLFALRGGVAGENRPCLLHRETGPLHIVCQHPAGGAPSTRVSLK